MDSEKTEDIERRMSNGGVVSIPNFRIPRMSDEAFYEEHLNDPNFDLTRRPRLRKRRTRPTSFELDQKADGTLDYDQPSDTESHADSDHYSSSRTDSGDSAAVEFDDESPYPEVRAAVSSTDDPSIPVNTFRMWFLGICFTILIPGLNQFFSMRYPSAYITGIVVQLIALPFGKGLARILPTTRFNTFGHVWSLNPGPFSIKEHVCITIMSNVVINGAYASDVIATQRVFYHTTTTLGYQLTLVVGSQLLGFSLGGILRRFVVWPAAMIWPGALVNSALFNTLHQTYGNQDQRRISREKFFLFCVLGSFLWYWVPGFLFTALSEFNWVCWIAPNNLPVNVLFGTVSGLGMGIFTFDWSMITYIGSPLVTPWWSELNTSIALVLCFWIICPILYFTNTFNTKYLPISTYTTFNNKGTRYDPNRIVTNGTFDIEKYRAYSPLFASMTLIMTYGTAFAASSSMVVHTILWFRKDIVRRFKSSIKDERDVHARLMAVYKEVPQWWYASIAVVTFSLLLVAIHLYPTQLPIWAACMAFGFAIVLSVPLATIQAITNQSVTLNILFELIAGYMIPGRPVANMVFKAVAYITTNQAINFAGDLKVGHYMKIPPRIMFSIQLVAAFISCFVVIFVQNWMFNNIEDFCQKGQKDGFSCPTTNTFASASLIWGGIGPRRLFSPGAPYSPMLLFFIFGALLPIPFYYLARRSPLSFWRYVNIPVFFAGVSAIPPANGINYASWAIVGFTFNYLVRRKYFRWWMRYNYTLSAGLDAGLAIGMVVVFFTVMFPKGGFNIVWWGNTVWQNTADANGMAMLSLAEGETFGPKTWM